MIQKIENKANDGIVSISINPKDFSEKLYMKRCLVSSRVSIPM